VIKINSQRCTKCGTQITNNAVYCQKCGSKIEIEKEISAAYLKEKKIVTTIKNHEPTKNYSPKRRKMITGISISIILIIIVPLILITVFGSINFINLGTLEFEVNSFEITNIDLAINNNFGSVDIEYDNSMAKLMETIIYVKGKTGAKIDQAKNFEMITESEKLIIEFDSGEYEFFFWNKKAFFISNVKN